MASIAPLLSPISSASSVPSPPPTPSPLVTSSVTSVSCSSPSASTWKTSRACDEAEILRIRQKYANQMKERKVRLYQRALDEAMRRERMQSAIRVNFCLKFDTRFGQNVFIVGSHHLLGGWQPEKALPMTWTEGNVWRCTLTLSPVWEVVTLQYKYLLKESSSSHVEWECGNNHLVKLENVQKEEAVICLDQWGRGGVSGLRDAWTEE